MRTEDTDQLLKEIDAVIAETLTLFGDHDPLEARRLALGNAAKFRAMSERTNHETSQQR
jgi:hypothetical protein